MKYSKTFYGVALLLLAFTAGCGKTQDKPALMPSGEPETAVPETADEPVVREMSAPAASETGLLPGSSTISPALSPPEIRISEETPKESKPRRKIDWSIPEKKTESSDQAPSPKPAAEEVTAGDTALAEEAVPVPVEEVSPKGEAAQPEEKPVTEESEPVMQEEKSPAEEILFEETVTAEESKNSDAEKEKEKEKEIVEEGTSEPLPKEETAEESIPEDVTSEPVPEEEPVIEEAAPPQEESVIEETASEETASEETEETLVPAEETSSVTEEESVIEEETVPMKEENKEGTVGHEAASTEEAYQRQVPPPWAYGTEADSFLSSNPTNTGGRIAGNMRDSVQGDEFDPFRSNTSTEAPADSGGEEGTPKRDPFGGSDDSAQAEGMESSEIKPLPPLRPATAASQKSADDSSKEASPKLTAEEEEALNTPPEELTAVEQYLMEEAERSPIRLMESVGTLVQLRKTNLVKRLLKKFLEKDLEPEDYIEISEKVKAASLTRLAGDPVYAPDGLAVVKRILDGTKNYQESKSRIENALNIYLVSASDTEKAGAVHALLQGRETAVSVLLERLVGSEEAQETAAVSELLYRMGEDARAALLELLLFRNDASVKASAILTRLGKKTDARLLFPLVYDPNLTESQRALIAENIVQLTGKVPTQQVAATQLYTDAMNYFRGRVPFRTDADGHVLIWIVKEGDKVPRFTHLSESDASRYFAEKYARVAAFLGQNNPAFRTLWLAAYFDFQGREAGIDVSMEENKPMTEAILKVYTLEEIETVLKFAMTHDHPIAARVAVELLGKTGTAETLLYKQNSAVVKAAGYTDRRVRFAALKAVMKLNPQKPYQGSSVVSESLLYFTKSGGIKKAVVAAPKIADSQAIAALLLPLGYKPETAVTGRDAMRMAINSADTELMMMDSRTPTTGMNYLLQEMYLDNRTHDVPVAVYANDGDEARSNKAVAGAVRARAYYRPYDEESVRMIVEHLFKETGVEHVPVELRLKEAKDAIAWVVQLFERKNIYKFENIEEAAQQIIWTPELAMEAMDLLSLIRSVNSQLMLAGIASEALNPSDRRQKAVEAFGESVKRYGVLLRGRQILCLYDYYNAGANEPKESQQIRGELLDIIESYAENMK
ncbi:MAG: hypothetical protein LBQ54_04695 [Planctomycetaceae bacterium]|jgi:hypothetical protein|nr:hypothetical protein [Planctomycetaceae bacterium]